MLHREIHLLFCATKLGSAVLAGAVGRADSVVIFVLRHKAALVCLQLEHFFVPPEMPTPAPT